MPKLSKISDKKKPRPKTQHTSEELAEARYEMTELDEKYADYTGLALDIKSTPEKNMKQRKNQNHHKTATDEFKPNQVPRSEKKQDITLGRRNSSANTTSPSALISSGANKKL